MQYVGIDPGVNGGIAVLRDYTYDVTEWDAKVVAMPSTEADLWDVIKPLSSFNTVAVIEFVQAFPTDGRSSIVTFATNYGNLRAFLVAAEIPLLEAVTAAKWQKALGITKPKRHTVKGVKRTAKQKAADRREGKRQLKAKAQQLFPALHITLKTCDALLIATYCKRKNEGLL